MPNPGPGPRYDALLQLLRTAEALWNASRVFFARWDLSPSQFNILNLLRHRSGGSTQTELSRELIMHRSNLTGLVDRLEKRGLVVRHSDPTDRRVHQVAITPSGRKLVMKILPFYYVEAEQVWGNISAARAGQLIAELGHLAENAARLSAEPSPSMAARRRAERKSGAKKESDP